MQSNLAATLAAQLKECHQLIEELPDDLPRYYSDAFVPSTNLRESSSLLKTQAEEARALTRQLYDLHDIMTRVVVNPKQDVP